MKLFRKLIVLSALVIAVSMIFSISSFASEDHTLNLITVWGAGRSQADIDQHNLDPNSLNHHAQISFFTLEPLPENWFETVKDYIIFDGYSFDEREFLDGGFHGPQGENGYMYIVMAGSYPVNDPITIEILEGVFHPDNTGVYKAPELAGSIFVKQEATTPTNGAGGGTTPTTAPVQTTPGDPGVLVYLLVAGTTALTIKKIKK